MGLQERRTLFQRIEAIRGRPLISYVTSDRTNALGQMGADVIPEFTDQLTRLPANTKSIDLVIVSQGGDANVAWRIVSLIRERVGEFRVLVPRSAFSAATLVALGADRIYMHPYGNLGPVDPQISVPQRRPDGGEDRLQFGSEDLAAFLTYAKQSVGLSDQAHLLKVFERFIESVGPVPIGIAARGAQHSIAMGEQLLGTRRRTGKRPNKEQARAIVETLNKKFFHHGYAVSREEARGIGLPVETDSSDLDSALDELWVDLERDLLLREPFNPLAVVKKNPNAGVLFGPIPILNLPLNAPPALVQNLQMQLAQQALVYVPATPYSIVNAVLESDRHASRYRTEGLIFAARRIDLQIHLSATIIEAGWRLETMV
jgi:hypothetical protein